MPIPLERSQANVIRLHPIQGKMKDASKLPRQAGSVSITPPHCSQIWGALRLVINGLLRFLYKPFFIFPFSFFFLSPSNLCESKGTEDDLGWFGLGGGTCSEQLLTAASHLLVQFPSLK